MLSDFLELYLFRKIEITLFECKSKNLFLPKSDLAFSRGFGLVADLKLNPSGFKLFNQIQEILLAAYCFPCYN
jgi:hypothetical protein